MPPPGIEPGHAGLGNRVCVRENARISAGSTSTAYHERQRLRQSQGPKPPRAPDAICKQRWSANDRSTATGERRRRAGRTRHEEPKQWLYPNERLRILHRVWTADGFDDTARSRAVLRRRHALPIYVAARAYFLNSADPSFLDAFWPALASGLIGGLVVLGMGYYLIEKRLRLRERAESERQTRRAVLQIVNSEMLHNASHLNLFIDELPQMQIPSPGFELGGWVLVSQAPALLTLRADTADKLVHAYNRMRSANEQRDQLLDLVNGPSALRMAIAAAEAQLPDDTYPDTVAKVISEYEAHKTNIRDGLLRRLDDLKLFLDNAIDAIEAELEIVSPVKAAGRRFLHTTPPDRLTLPNAKD
jgi:hypothetical protein